MDPSHNMSIKKQRNAKIQRDKRKNTHSKKNTVDVPDPEPNEELANSPQPQRVNRRQQNEQPSVPPSTTPNETSKVTSQESNEKLVVDHSNLKRETEEITKLTKRFSKREVTSNWHRYSTEEKSPSVEQLEEDGPADFTELLQVPLSRGGHLQLKEEQGWSSVVPRGHWALDLKQLSFSQACIPTHERLRLPLDKLSDEEIQRYTFLAEEAKKYYETYNESDLKQDVAYMEKPFNILDVDRSTNTLINMSLDPDKSPNSISVDMVAGTLENKCSVISEEEKTSIKDNVSFENKETQKINDILNNEVNIKSEEKSSNLLLEKSKQNNIPHMFGKEKVGNDHLANEQQKLNDKNPEHNEINESKIKLPLHTDNILSVGPDNKSLDVESKSISYEIKDKRQSRRSNRMSPKAEEIDKGKGNEMKLEDDDLDFLLSLQKPVPSEKKNESQPVPLKDTSFLPGVKVATTSAQQTDLDDWLDSVLED